MTSALRSLLAFAILVVACSPNDVVLHSRFAPGFDGSRRTISVLGVYKDGRLSADSWGNVAASIARWLGGRRCVAGYSESFVAGNPELSLAIDDYAREHGPTEELLGRIAPAATGDLVLVVTIAGHPPATARSSLADEAAQRSAARGARQRRASDANRLDLSALLFSASDARVVGVVELDYGGASWDDALQRFADRLGATLPGATCAGWAWEGKVDAASVLALRGDGD
jgi:hypothetical protein